VELWGTSVLAAAVSAAALAGCGGGSNDNASSSSSSTQTPPAQSPGGGGSSADQVSMSEYKFAPSTVSAKAGSTLTVNNSGSIQHDLKLRQGSKEVGGTPLVDAGSSAKLKLKFKPGTYVMFCSVPGHEQLGMKGSFTVR
jgi:plastocyanin